MLNLETSTGLDEKLHCLELHQVCSWGFLHLVHAEEIPLFVKITLIVHIWANWILVGKLFATTEFSRHLHSHHIREADELSMFTPGDEVDLNALDGKDLITLIHRPLKALPPKLR